MNDYLWKLRCPESGYIVAECGCTYCFDEFEMDANEFDYLEEDLEGDFEDPFWDEFEFDIEDMYEEDEEYYE